MESTVASYFDLTGAPANRRLAFGAPETSPCPLLGGGGMHTGWVVPVVYDTSGGKGKAPAGGTGKSTAAQATPAQLATSGTVSMDQISITGTRYFFWFSSDTLSAVTRRIDQCP
ncbi:MAG TPA: hypothetical protein VJ743_20485 [Albitalea sp.]|nr:hypothetical protein [Albitalea sp.]